MRKVMWPLRAVVVSLDKIKALFLNNKHVRVMAAMLLLAVVGSYAAYVRVNGSTKHFSGSPACIALVKQVEGSTFDQIYSLTCTLESRTIGNSTLSAQYYSYSGLFKDPADCNDSLDNASLPPLPPCPKGEGVILSNGQRYASLGNREHIDDRPFSYDECYAGVGGIDVLYPPAPTTRDLYFYKGGLWDRDVYKNAPVKTVVGTCFVNGTTLTSYAHDGGIVHYTNVVASYPNFPKDCSNVPIGSDGDDFYRCVNLVTAARADLTVCHSGLDIVQTKDYKIQAYKQGAPGTPTPWCEDPYVQRMAALNACNLITDPTLRDKCRPLVDHPYFGTTRVFGRI